MLYIEKSFDTIFNIGCGWGVKRPTPSIMSLKIRPCMRGLILFFLRHLLYMHIVAKFEEIIRLLVFEGHQIKDLMYQSYRAISITGVKYHGT